MKIAILTHMIHYGVGGVMQNYALQTILKRMGHTPITLRPSLFPKGMEWGFKHSQLYWALTMPLKRIMGKSPAFSKNQYENIICKETEQYIKRNLLISDYNYNGDDFLANLKKEQCEAIIVGSDQIWRKNFRYTPNCFLDFAENLDIIRIAYAGSFAINYWEFSPKETQQYSKLAQKFDAISVREESGVKLCKDNLGVDAEWVLDPTLLLDKDDYLRTIPPGIDIDCELMSYFLDKTDIKDSIVNSVSARTGLKICNAIPNYLLNYDNVKNFPKECVFPGMDRWLKMLERSKLIITDSFHGTALSIIFNKPFYVIVNNHRGAERFISLLQMFNLSDRIITTESDVDLTRPINWDVVNKKRKELQSYSLLFLENNLSRKQ